MACILKNLQFSNKSTTVPRLYELWNVGTFFPSDCNLTIQKLYEYFFSVLIVILLLDISSRDKEMLDLLNNDIDFYWSGFLILIVGPSIEK